MDQYEVMNAVVMTRYGDGSGMQIRQVPRPTIAANEILVRVKASSVNPVDWKVRRGEVKFLSGKKLPRRLGADYSGIIEQVGDQITNLKPGDEVFGMKPAFTGDAYAQFISVKENEIALKPVNLSFSEAAVIPLVGLTIYQLFFQVANITPGSKVMINGCTGGIGHIAVQVAKTLNCEVTGVCSAKNIAYAKSIGVDHVIDYATGDVLANTCSYDLFFDAVANCSFKQAKATLKPNGQYVCSIPSWQNMLVAPIFNLLRAKKHKKVWVEASAKNLTALRTLIETGHIKPTIERTYPIEQIANAHQHSESGKVVGKIALSF